MTFITLPVLAVRSASPTAPRRLNHWMWWCCWLLLAAWWGWWLKGPAALSYLMWRGKTPGMTVHTPSQPGRSPSDPERSP
jgi:hypothetical protein